MHVDEALKQFAQSGDPNERRSVIIEPRAAPVAAPARTVQAASRNKTDVRSSPDRDAFQKVARHLTALGIEVTSLELVGSMIGELTPEQLRQVMSWPSVAAIRANQSRRAIRTPES